MDRRNLLSSLRSDLKTWGDMTKELDSFFEANQNLENSEFYKKLEEDLPWIKYRYRSQKMDKLKKIESHLSTIKTIILIVLIGTISSGIIVAVLAK